MNDLNNNSQLLIYQSPSGDIKLDVRLESETVWLTQKHMAELFQTSVPNISMHLKSIYEDGELEEPATIKDFLIVQKEGDREIGRKLLQHAGTISHEKALEKSGIEYQKYKDTQKLLEREKSLKELETDIDELKKQLPTTQKGPDFVGG
jgi:hypothetical protein